MDSDSQKLHLGPVELCVVIVHIFYKEKKNVKTPLIKRLIFKKKSVLVP